MYLTERYMKCYSYNNNRDIAELETAVCGTGMED